MSENIIKVIKDAGKIIFNAHNDHDVFDGIQRKQGDTNFVTVYDKRVQDFLFQELGKHFSHAEFVGEEDVKDVRDISTNNKLQFLIDPIDGTTNFIFDYKHSSISVGIMKKGEIIQGYVYNPYLDEMFSAKKDQGAYLNEKKITVTNTSIKDGLASFGTAPYHREYTDKTITTARKLLENSLDCKIGKSRCGTYICGSCFI